MRVWIGRMPAAVCWLVLTAAVGAAPPNEQLQSWIRQLDADDFASREAAARHLAAAGEAAIEPLAAAMASSSPEIAWRATAALEQIAIRGSDPTFARVARALERLRTASPAGLAAVAGELQAKRARLRHERAAATIRALGGKFAGDELADPVAAVLVPPLIIEEDETEVAAEVARPAGIEALGAALKSVAGLFVEPAAAAKPHPLPDPPPELPPADSAPPVELPILADAFIADAFVGPEFVDSDAFGSAEVTLLLDRSWRGGDEGLSALCDLTGLGSLSLHGAKLTDAALDKIAALPGLATLDTEGMRFSREAWARFRARRPNTRVFARGEALLGISADANGPCVITSVVDGSGAAQAGLESGDEITTVDGQPVRDFSDLTIAISSYKPGEKVALKYNRDGRERSAEVNLNDRKVVPAIR